MALKSKTYHSFPFLRQAVKAELSRVIEYETNYEVLLQYNHRTIM
jgi:hypothetical protein